MRRILLLPLLLAGACATPQDGTQPIDGPPRQDHAERVSRTPGEERRLMRSAMEVHLAHGHHDAAHLIEHALHARELAQSGREDEEALRIRSTAPRTEMVRRQLRRAAEICVDEGKGDLGRDIAALSDDLWEDQLAGTREPPRTRDDAHDREIAVVRERIEVLEWAAQAWSEARRPEIVEHLERAIVARRMAIEGRRDDEARAVRERAPGPGDLAEFLHGAGRLYDEKGWETRSAACFELSEVFREQWRRKGGAAREEPPADGRIRELEERLRRFMERTERLEEKVRQLTERLERLESER